MEEITTQMSERLRGGCLGIEITTEQQYQFASFIGSEYIDEYMPLPGVENKVQRHRIKKEKCTHEKTETLYWEAVSGSHGWCCEYCGKVVQWG